MKSETIYISIALMLFLIVGYYGLYYFSQEIIECRIIDKERITESNGKYISSKYLIFTEEETFENTDEYLFLKFNSSDLQGSIKVDSVYKLNVIGWRIPYLSIYRNVMEVNN